LTDLKKSTSKTSTVVKVKQEISDKQNKGRSRIIITRAEGKLCHDTDDESTSSRGVMPVKSSSLLVGFGRRPGQRTPVLLSTTIGGRDFFKNSGRPKKFCNPADFFGEHRRT
jgi:hypothetical protein